MITNSFLEDHNSLPIHISNAMGFGLGSFRLYINASTPIVSVGDYGVSRWYALQFITNSIITNLQDREVPLGTNSTNYAGTSFSSSILSGVEIANGTTLFGDFVSIKLTSGSAIVFGF